MNLRQFTPFVCLLLGATSPAVLAQHGHGDDRAVPAASQSAERIGDPYPLETCPVSGEKLGTMGDPVVKVYDGREVRFCCEKCVPKFEAKQAEYLAKIDEQILDQQEAFCTTTTCIVSGESLEEDGEDISVSAVCNNRLVRFCCKDCKADFEKDPQAYLEKLDKATADSQRETYPLDTCVVSGEKLGEMGDPYEVVIANRLIRLCCEDCVEKLEAEPVRYLNILDEAWEAKGFPSHEHEQHEQPTKPSNGGHGDHDHGHG